MSLRAGTSTGSFIALALAGGAAVSDLQALYQQASAIAASAQSLLGARYHRVTVPLSGPVALDDASDAAYATMDASLASFYGSDAYTAVTTWLRALVAAS